MKGRVRLVAMARRGNIEAFARYFFWLTALKLNRLLQRTGRFWRRGRIVDLEDLGDSAAEQVARAVDPVSAGDVESRCWLAGRLRSGITTQVARPTTFATASRLPARVEVTYLSLTA